MNEQRKNNGRGIFYGVIGVATLVVAIIGATFAYFTATASAGENVITGNMASINFGLTVEKVTTVDETKGGMIPMSNTMVEAAASNSNGVCTDDNGNAVCQIYRITVTNTGTASLFLDGYVTLTNADGKAYTAPTDVTTWTNITGADSQKPTMRWAQVFQNSSVYTTAGNTTTRLMTTANGDTLVALNSIDAPAGEGTGQDNTGFNRANILTTGVTGTGYLGTNSYEVINKNYIRISDHNPEATTYTRTTDVTSALVYNQYLDATGTAGGTSSVDYYIIVWLAETGTNQTPANNDAALQFFSGKVTFLSAQGSEVTATFGSYSRVPSGTGQTQSGG